MKDFLKDNWISVTIFVSLILFLVGLDWYSNTHEPWIVTITFDKNGRVTKFENSTPFDLDIHDIKITRKVEN